MKNGLKTSIYIAFFLFLKTSKSFFFDLSYEKNQLIFSIKHKFTTAVQIFIFTCNCHFGKVFRVLVLYGKITAIIDLQKSNELN